jgi:hypothetical protein
MDALFLVAGGMGVVDGVSRHGAAWRQAHTGACPIRSRVVMGDVVVCRYQRGLFTVVEVDVVDSVLRGGGSG